MYTEFYDLKEKPFNLTPSPRFLYLGEGHREALNLLKYGIMERKGFILLTGEIGTGKTTMIQALLSTVDDSVHCIHLCNPLLSPGEFMDYLACSAFYKKLHVKSKAEFLIEFEEFLRQCLRQQKNVILIIDEAQRLSFELLEEIRLLSNMETGDEKLINIFLVGQPELNEKLSKPQCLPLLQRISMRYHIPPLDLEGTRGYMATRLRIAGAPKGDEIFSKSAVKAIHQYSRGYPRVINILADNALLLGYSKEKKPITPSMVRECYEDMGVEGAVPSRRARDVPETVQVRKPRRFYIARYWKWAAVAVALIVILAGALSQEGRKAGRELSWLQWARHQLFSDKVAEEQVQDKKEASPETASLPRGEQIRAEPLAPIGTEQQKREPMGSLTEEEPAERENLLKRQDRGSFRSLSVKEGVICRSVYNRLPLVAGSTFDSSVYVLYCFTKIVGAHSPTEITHVWYFGDTEKARVSLPVKSSGWRTYSSKQITNHEIGDWHVDVLGPGGELLRVLRFEIRL